MFVVGVSVFFVFVVMMLVNVGGMLCVMDVNGDDVWCKSDGWLLVLWY